MARPKIAKTLFTISIENAGHLDVTLERFEPLPGELCAIVANPNFYLRKYIFSAISDKSDLMDCIGACFRLRDPHGALLAEIPVTERKPKEKATTTHFWSNGRVSYAW